MLKKLDKLANELYAEFGFNTCTEKQQEDILPILIKNKNK